MKKNNALTNLQKENEELKQRLISASEAFKMERNTNEKMLSRLLYYKEEINFLKNQIHEIKKNLLDFIKNLI